MTTALEAAGDKNLVLFGASIPPECVAAGLLDEIMVVFADADWAVPDARHAVLGRPWGQPVGEPAPTWNDSSKREFP
ncbi:MAG: hypothetical protein M3082_00265 [Candidatus Dormibacteraeota bacterium]|nr:hypothetical protein [Candidatus Dormibacteraeota bacterium]